MSAAAAATAVAAVNGSRGRCQGGGVSASVAAAAPAAAALNGSRGRCRGGGASASAVAAATTAAAAFNGNRGRGSSGEETATAAVTAAGAGTVGGDRRSGCGDFGDGPVDTGSRKAHRRWNHSRRGVWSGNGGGDIHEGAAGPPGGAVVFARTATAAAVPCDTGGDEIKIERTATWSIKDVYASCGGGGYRADSHPAGRSLLGLGGAPSGPRTPVGDTEDVCTSARRAVRPHLGKGGAQGGGVALGGRDLRGGRGNVVNGEFRVVHVRSDLQHADFLTKPLHRKAFCVHRNFVMNIS